MPKKLLDTDTGETTSSPSHAARSTVTASP